MIQERRSIISIIAPTLTPDHLGKPLVPRHRMSHDYEYDYEYVRGAKPSTHGETRAS